MRVLVIVAHPNPNSLCQSLRHAVVDGLTTAGHDVDVIDLYDIGFDGAMPADERRRYLHTTADTPHAPHVADSIAKVRAAQMLVFVYPTWWSSMPAIMKAWLERTMVPGVGFVFNNHGKVRPGLTNITRIVGISTYGSSRLYVAAVNDNGRRILSRALRLSTGRAKVTWIAMYRVDKSSADQRANFVATVTRRMAEL